MTAARRRRWVSASLGVAAGALACFAAWLIDASESARYAAITREHVHHELAEVRAQLEMAVHQRIHLARGLESLAITHPDLADSEFHTFAHVLLGEQPGVRALQLARDGIVSHVHPEAGNEASKGHNLLTDPAVSQAAQEAINRGGMLLAGPYRLRQGGNGLVARLPVFRPATRANTKGVFWGFAIVVIDFDALIAESGLASARDVEIAVRGRNGRGGDGEVFIGAESVFDDRSVVGEVRFPNGSWVMAARPVGGWPVGWPGRWGVVATLVVLLVALAYIVIAEIRHAKLGAETERLALRDMLLNCLGEGVYGLDREGRCTFINPAALALLGRTRDEVIGSAPSMLFHAQPRCFDLRSRHEGEAWFIHRDGHSFPVHVIVAPLEDGEGAVVAFSDVSEQKRAGRRLRLAASVFANTQQGILITDASGTVLDVNPAFTEITGYGREEILGRNPRMLQSGRQGPEFYRALWRSLVDSGFWRGEIWNRHKSGREYPQLLSIAAVDDEVGGVSHYIGVFSDISQQKQHEAELARIAHHDALTGLPNRVLLTDRLTQSLDQARRSKTQVAVCLLDLDGFKAVNDQYGHGIGDKILIEVGRRLKATVRAGDTVARLGGDEFVLLLVDVEGEAGCHGSAHRVLNALAAPARIDGHEFAIRASIGITLFPEDASDADMLLRHADQAMYDAKQSGRNGYRLFDPERDRQARSHRETVERVIEALEKNEFVLHYQPKVNMRSGKVLGFEALIRWQHPERGLLGPAEFLPLLDTSELDAAIGRWVLGEAARTLEAWRAQGFTFAVSVNISARHLLMPAFVDELREILHRHPTLEPLALEIEILETVALADLEAATTVLGRCRELGVSIALDDFGTGYSSLAYFRLLPVDTLKMDQMFVRDMLGDPNDMAIVEGIIGFAKAFNRVLIAEGVETPELCVLLLGMGCEIGQGHAIAAAMPAAQVAGWLQRFRPHPDWSAAERWHVDELPLLAAELDHRRWVGTIESFLGHAPGTAHPPPMDERACRFGRWYHGRSRKRYSQCPAYVTLGEAHRAVHRLGEEFVRLHSEGRADEARARFPELLTLRDRLLGELAQLRTQSAPRRARESTLE